MKPDFKKILKIKIAYYGDVPAAYEFAADEYERQWINHYTNNEVQESSPLEELMDYFNEKANKSSKPMKMLVDRQTLKQYFPVEYNKLLEQELDSRGKAFNRLLIFGIIVFGLMFMLFALSFNDSFWVWIGYRNK